MNDYLDFLEKYKDFKEISDIVDEVRKLRVYYHTQQYDKMQQHINKLTSKYLAETYAWNTTFSSMPATVEQAYKNAEDKYGTYGAYRAWCSDNYKEIWQRSF